MSQPSLSSKEAAEDFTSATAFVDPFWEWEQRRLRPPPQFGLLNLKKATDQCLRDESELVDDDDFNYLLLSSFCPPYDPYRESSRVTEKAFSIEQSSFIAWKNETDIKTQMLLDFPDKMLQVRELGRCKCRCPVATHITRSFCTLTFQEN